MMHYQVKYFINDQMQIIHNVMAASLGTVSIAMMGVCLVAMVNSPEEVGITGIETMANSGKDDKGNRSLKLTFYVDNCDAFT